jgi:hypothetical protein
MLVHQFTGAADIFDLFLELFPLEIFVIGTALHLWPTLSQHILSRHFHSLIDVVIADIYIQMVFHNPSKLCNKKLT